MNSFTLLSRYPEDTAAIAHAVASDLRPGDAVLLNGGLAAGKTCFVAGVVHALGSTDAVTSPTFSIANFYVRPGGTILHMDAYRLSSITEFRDLALEDHFETAITLIEWGALVEAAFPAHLSIAFAEEGDRRVLTFAAHGPRWVTALPYMAQRLGAAT